MTSPVTTLAPFRVAPYFRTRIWGFQDLNPWFDFVAEGEPIGEVWLTGEECTAATGPLAGKTLKAITAEYSDLILGADAAEKEFPLLVKILFPREKLSVQVHPDDALAQQFGEPRGKTECWYALGAEPGAAVALGIKPGVSVDQVESAILDASLEDLLEWLPVTKDDMIFVAAGTVHAIGPGSVLLETQQTSDLTYRLYDYGRPRELHLDKGLTAIKLATKAGRVAPRVEGDRTVLVDAQYFRVEKLELEGAVSSRRIAGASRPQLQILFAAEGTATLRGSGFEKISVAKCELVVVPASAGEWELEASPGFKLIRILAQ